MRRAIELAFDGMRAGLGGPFGAVVVKAGEVVGSGQNRVTSLADPTAHAEIIAVRAACARLGTWSLAGCEIYASCEPCPMCLGAILWARLDRLWFAARRADAAAAGFDDARFHAELARPALERDLPSAELLRDEALAALREWQRKDDRTTY